MKPVRWRILFLATFLFISGTVFLTSPARAVEPLRIRVLTYNIHHGRGMDNKVDLERIARVIQSVEPDLVSLQEVDQKVRRTEQVDQPAELSRLTGLHVVFGSNIPLEGGEYGNAVLSRWPIKRHENHALPLTDGGQPRGVLEVEVEPAADRSAIVFLATHFDHRQRDRQRVDSAKMINDLAMVAKERLTILAGDLNAQPDSDTLAIFAPHWLDGGAGRISPTFPADKPRNEIDYVLARPAERFKVIETRVIDEAMASDHRPVLTVLDLTE